MPSLRTASFPLVLAALSVAAVPALAGEIRGRFLLGDKPAAGVTVSAVPYEAPLDEARREARRQPPPPALATARTGADGAFVLQVPAQPGRSILFTVRAEGGSAVAATMAGLWDAGETADAGEHALTPARELSGKVVDASGAPVSDADVVLTAPLDGNRDPDLDPWPRVIRTTTDGTFRFPGAAVSGNVVTADKPGLVAMPGIGLRGGALAKPLVLTPGIALAGSVTRPDKTSPAAGALVRLEAKVAGRWVEAGSDGKFGLTAPGPGIYTVVGDAGDAGYGERGSVRVPPDEGATVGLVLAAPSSVSGKVVDAKSGQPVPRVRIEAASGGAQRIARSAPDGSYDLRGIRPATWRVRADEARYVPWTHAGLNVRAGEAKRLDVPLVLGATLSGRVTDEDGKPVAGAAGTLLRTGAAMAPRLLRRMMAPETPIFRTRADGTFSASRLAPGASQILAVSHPDYERSSTGGVALTGGATRSGLAVVLKRGTSIPGVVKDGEGKAVAAAEVTVSQTVNFMGGRGGLVALVGAAMSGGPDPKRGTTDAEGRFAVRGVAPGEFTVTVEKAGYATRHVEGVKVPAGGAAKPLEIVLGPGAAISGKLVKRSGEGADGFVVLANPPGRPRFPRRDLAEEPRTGPDGTFRVDGLEPGARYDLQPIGPTGLADAKRGVPAPTQDVTLVVAGPGRITGRAVDAGDGHALTEFQVSYEPDRGGMRGAARALLGGGSAEAGGPGQPLSVEAPDGAFALEDVPAGTWSVAVSASGYQAAHTSGIVVEEGATRSGVEVRLTRGGVVKGRVADAQTGMAIANAIVSLAPEGGMRGFGALLAGGADGGVTTDAEGKFEIEGAAPGRQTLRATHPDYTDAVQTVQVTETGADVEIRMTGGGEIGGAVVTETGQPAAGATVALIASGAGGPFGGGPSGNQPNLTDAGGRFTFSHLEAGRYTVSAWLGSRTATPVDVVLQAGQSQDGLTVQLLAGVSIQGTVTGLSDAMLAGLTVTADGADGYSQATRVAADRKFEFDNVPVGLVMVRGTAVDGSGATRSVNKQITTTADQPVATADLVFDTGYTLSGQVTQAGQPVSGASVVANLQGGGGRQATAVTNDAGSYQMSGLQEGTYTVVASAGMAGPGVAKRQTIDLTADQTVDFSLPASTIDGQVMDASTSAPLSGASVAIPGQRPSVTDSTGKFSFSGLDVGTYTLTTSKADYEVDKRDVTLGDNGAGNPVIALKRAAGIDVVAQDGLSGLPMRSVVVRVVDPQGSAILGPTPIALDSNGEGEIPSVPPGSYTVLAGATGYAVARQDGVTVPGTAVSLRFTPGGTVVLHAGATTLAAHTAVGTIASATGQPAMLSLFNLQGRIAISEPAVQLRNVPPGSYVVTLPALAVNQPITVAEGQTTDVPLP